MTVTDDRQIGIRAPLRLSAGQIDQLEAASLQILERTGICFDDTDALALFKHAGVRVSDGNVVHIPAQLVEWALGCAPRSITIYDREGQPSMQLGQDRCYYGVGSDCAYLYDIDNGQRRKAVLADVVQGLRLVDALPNVDFAMSLMLPSDVPLGRHEPYQMAAMLAETTKPIVFVGETEQSTVCALEMAAAVVGSLETLAQKPFVINYANTISALDHNRESVRRLLYAAARNLPSVYAPGLTRGTVAPVTPAGAVALGNAGQLAGLVLSQLAREGSPFIRSVPGGGVMDMRTLVGLYVAPDDGLMGWDLARRYNLPLFGIGGCSDAKLFDTQAASEAAMSLFSNTLNGASLIHDMGYLDCAMTYSYELLALCDDLVAWQKRYFQPPRIDDETLALDLIHAVGHHGSFLDSDHTFEHFRNDWQPALFDRYDFDRWHEQGHTALAQRAREKVRLIIDAHRCPPLPAEVVQSIEKLRRKYTQPA